MKEGKFPEAKIIALFGEELSIEETQLRPYYEAVEELEACTKKEIIYRGYPGLKIHDADMSVETILRVQMRLEQQKERLCKIFLDAVNSYDGEKIMHLARAVWSMRDKCRAKAADPDRLKLLFLKTALEHSGDNRPLTIRQIARYLALEEIAAGKKLVTSADGFSALRRKCKALGIPVAPSRKRSRK